MTGSHAKRWVTGIVAVPLLFAVIYFGSEAVFAGLIVLITAVAVLEYNRLVYGAAGAALPRALARAPPSPADALPADWRTDTRPDVSADAVPADALPALEAELRQALALTQDRLAEDVRFEDIASDVGLAPRSLARRFEDECGATWRAVVRRMRVLRAVEELAAGDDSVTTIAHTVGYTSLSAFNAAFRDLTGRTPTQYRATFRP